MEAILEALNGEVHLIVGNNDGSATLSLRRFASVQRYAELEIEGVRLILCDYPFRSWNGMANGAINLHGHSHGRLKPVTRQIDVGVDAWDFKPIPSEAILAYRRRSRRS